MSRNKVYSIDFMLKIKQVNPNWQFEGKNKEIWEETMKYITFIKSQDKNSLLRTIDGMKEAKDKKKSVKKVKQVANRKNTESLDYFVKNEAKKKSDEEL